ncbi:MAG: hypothetical protein NTX64_05940 [Elusimicrobia bacterium]|nr:hypothetical protein [Elusimicrobiota bacterium]
MNRRVLLLFFGVSLAGLGRAQADVGPKPTESFRLDFGSGPARAVAGRADLLQCDNAECADPKHLFRVGPQGFDCAAASCDAMAYGFSDYQKLVLGFDDGEVRESGVFARSQAVNASYVVSVEPGRLVVREVTRPRGGIGRLGAAVGVRQAAAGDFGVAFALTLVIELALAGLYALLGPGFDTKLRLRFVASVAAANAITVPMIWFVLPRWLPLPLTQEFVVWAFETLFLYSLNRRVLSFRRACVLSLVMNLASGLADVFIPL